MPIDRPERVERPVEHFERPEGVRFDVPVERVERPEIPERVEMPERPMIDFDRQDMFFRADRPDYERIDFSAADFDPYVGYQPSGFDDIGSYLGFDARPEQSLADFSDVSLGIAPSYGYDAANLPGGERFALQEMDWWDKFKYNLAQQFSPGNLGRGLATSAILNMATGGGATAAQLLGGLAIGGVAGAGGRTVAQSLPEDFAPARNAIGAAAGGGIGALAYGQNPLLGAAASGFSRLGSDITEEAIGGPEGRLAGAAVGGGLRSVAYGGDFGEGAERGMTGAALSGALTGGEGGGPRGEMSDLQRLSILARGAYGLREAREMRQLSEQVARGADPWAASGGRAAADAQLQALLRDPTALANDPAFKLRQQAAMRASAIHGADSGAMSVAAANASTDWYNQRLAQLGGISGATVDPGTAQQLRLAARRNANDLSSSSLATLGYGLAS